MVNQRIWWADLSEAERELESERWEVAQRNLAKSAFPGDQFWRGVIRRSGFEPDTGQYQPQSSRRSKPHTLKKYATDGSFEGYAVRYEYAYCVNCQEVKRQWVGMVNPLTNSMFTYVWMNGLTGGAD